MAEERDVEHLREQIYDHEGRISSLEAWRDNVRTRHASTPTWIFGAVAALMSAASLIANLWLAGVGP